MKTSAKSKSVNFSIENLISSKINFIKFSMGVIHLKEKQKVTFRGQGVFLQLLRAFVTTRCLQVFFLEVCWEIRAGSRAVLVTGQEAEEQEIREEISKWPFSEVSCGAGQCSWRAGVGVRDVRALLGCVRYRLQARVRVWGCATAHHDLAINCLLVHVCNCTSDEIKISCQQENLEE